VTFTRSQKLSIHFPIVRVTIWRLKKYVREIEKNWIGRRKNFSQEIEN